MNIDDYNFDVPEELIAINPSYPRDRSSLVEVKDNFLIHKFNNILNILNKGDCLILNDTKVIPGQLKGKMNGKNVSITLNKLIKTEENLVIWNVFGKPYKSFKSGEKIYFSQDFFCKIIRKNKMSNYGGLLIEFNMKLKNFFLKLTEYGQLAIPPYITKKRDLNDKDIFNYQSIFAKNSGAIAAPTASLHFTSELLRKIRKKGINIVYITLHVNGGTFIPIRTNNIEDHQMHSEEGEISKIACKIINEVKVKNKRCVAVGTTVLRLLESSKDYMGNVLPFKGETEIFIKPGWKITTVDGLITNFHTPKSSLFVLISSILGEKNAKKLYEFAIKKKLRFFSYGDACLIWIKK